MESAANKKQKQIFYMILIFSVFLMLLLNYLTPLLGDDYSYSFSWKDQSRITNLKDIFESMHSHYLKWGGRIFTHFIATCFLLMGKPIFNIANVIVYSYMTLLLYRYATVNSHTKYNCSIYLLVHLCLWFALPVYGQNILWLIGSCNYMWGAAIILAFIWPYYHYVMTGYEYKNKYRMFTWPFLGILAGGSNENTSGAGILFVFFLFVLMKWSHKKIPLWTISGFVGQILGFVFMIAAPGNYIRLSTSAENSGFLITYGTRLSTCNSMLYDYLFPFIIAFVAILVLLMHSSIATPLQKAVTALLGITSVACNYVMIFSPEYPKRALLGSCIFLIIGILYGTCTLLMEYPIIWVRVAAYCLLACFCIHCCDALLDIGYTYRTFNRRVDSIIEQRDSGIMDIVTYRIEPKTKYNALYGLEDLQGYPTHWLNGNTSSYFGINSIVAYPDEESTE